MWANLLDKSLFYYCSGKDPTPILAFGASIPLYVYVDLLKSARADFSSVTEALYDRLEAHGLMLGKRRALPTEDTLAMTKDAEETVWRTPDGETFTLLFLAADATAAYRALYKKETLPRCICNYRYEMDNTYLGRIERQVSRILGHCHSEGFAPIAEYPYYGDYAMGDRATVTLYEKM